MEIIGILGTIMFSICGIEPAYKAYKNKTASFPWSFILLWFGGETFTMMYVIWIADYILLFNYIFNFLCLLVIIRYNNR
jgi:lipid-A-disaccharide synthase-like uncharacterized protein